MYAVHERTEDRTLQHSFMDPQPLRGHPADWWSRSHECWALEDQISWPNWLGQHGGGGSYSTVDVEILHKNYPGEYSLSTIFLNPILIGVSIYHFINIPNAYSLFE